MSHRNTSLLLVAALTLAACGGGGGGGGAPPTNPPPPAPPPPAAFALSDANAYEAAVTGIGSIEQAMSTAELGTFAFVNLSLYGGTQMTALCRGGVSPAVPVALSYDDNDSNSVISAGDVVRASHGSCFDFSRQISIRVSVADSASGRLEGRAELTVESDFGVRLTGNFDLVMAPDAGGVRWSIANLSLTRATSSGSDSITAASTERTVAAAGSAYRVTLAGVVQSDRIGGSFNVATVTPLSGTLGSFPTTGELRMTAGSSHVRIGPAVPAGSELAYAVDATGSGQYAAEKRAHWLALLGGPIFGVAPNMRPRLTNLTLLPASPNAGDTLQASYTALDPDGPAQNSTFQCRRNGELLAGETAATLAPGRHRRGDTIDVTALIDDGIVTVTATAAASIVNAPPQLSSTVISPKSCCHRAGCGSRCRRRGPPMRSSPTAGPRRPRMWRRRWVSRRPLVSPRGICRC